MYLLLISSYLWDWNSYVGCVLPFNNIASALLLERDYFKDPPDGCHLMWVLSLIIIYIHKRVYIIKSSCIFHIYYCQLILSLQHHNHYLSTTINVGTVMHVRIHPIYQSTVHPLDGINHRYLCMWWSTVRLIVCFYVC